MDDTMTYNQFLAALLKAVTDVLETNIAIKAGPPEQPMTVLRHRHESARSAVSNTALWTADYCLECGNNWPCPMERMRLLVEGDD